MVLPFLKLFPDFLQIVSALDDAARGRLLLAAMKYLNGEEPDELTGGEQIAFIALKIQMDRDAQAYEQYIAKQRENGRKGGRPRRREQIEARESRRSRDEAAESSQYNSRDNYRDTNENKHENMHEDRQESLISPEPVTDDVNTFDGELGKAVDEWLCYKRERHEDYKPTGRKSLLSQIAANARQYGDRAVADIIRASMSSGYKGIVFDRLSRPTYGSRAAPTAPIVKPLTAREKREAERQEEMDRLVAEFMGGAAARRRTAESPPVPTAS